METEQIIKLPDPLFVFREGNYNILYYHHFNNKYHICFLFKSIYNQFCSLYQINVYDLENVHLYLPSNVLYNNKIYKINGIQRFSSNVNNCVKYITFNNLTICRNKKTDRWKLVK